MAEKTTRPRFRLPWAVAAIVVFVIFAPIALFGEDTYLFVSVFVVAPILLLISLVSIIWLIREAVRHRYRQILPVLAILFVLWAIPTSLFTYERNHPFELHDRVRWIVRSHKYKGEVLGQSNASKNGLKHIEWDGSGLAGIANNTVFLVFDPKDTLSTAAKSGRPGKINDIACEVRSIRRLESH